MIAMSRLHVDPADFHEVIEATVDATVRRLESDRPSDTAGRILLTKRQTAETFSVSDGTVDRWRAEAGLPFVKIDG
jgi:hypothetical protein